jgi:outer membrane biosynthesis protein TonB
MKYVQGGMKMKKWLWIPILVVVLILLSCQKKEKILSIDQELHDMLHAAMDSMEAGNASGGASLLIDAVLLTRPQEEMPEMFKEMLLSAKNHFLRDDFSEGGELVSEALVVFKSGLGGEGQIPDQEPADVPEKDTKVKVFPVAQKIKENILQSIDEFKNGNGDSGVILILESLKLFGPPSTD